VFHDSPFDDDCAVTPEAVEAADRYAQAARDLRQAREALTDDEVLDRQERCDAVRAAVAAMIEQDRWKARVEIRVERFATPKGGAFRVEVFTSAVNDEPGFEVASVAVRLVNVCRDEQDLLDLVATFTRACAVIGIVDNDCDDDPEV